MATGETQSDSEFDRELQEQKLRAEISKLSAETESLRKSPLLKPATWLPLLVAAAGIITALSQWQVSSIKAERKELETEKRVHVLNTKLESLNGDLRKTQTELDGAAESTKELEALRANLIKEISALEKTSEGLRVANDRLENITKTSELTSTQQSIVDKAANAKFSLGVYAFDISESAYAKVADALMSEGYTISQGTLLTQKPKWLALRSTVLYYDDESKPVANELAARIGRLVGHPIAIQRGAGLGVARGEEKWTFFIHVVG